MFEFLFHGTNTQYAFFLDSVKKRLGIQIDCDTPDEKNDRICRIEEKSDTIFLVGMILASCYSAYNN